VVLEIAVEGVEPLGPERAVALEPLLRRLHARTDKPAVVDAAAFLAGHQPGLFEDAKVLGHGRGRDAVGLGQFRDRGLAARQSREDGAADRVGERPERAVKMARTILNHMVKYSRDTQNVNTHPHDREYGAQEVEH